MEKARINLLKNIVESLSLSIIFHIIDTPFKNGILLIEHSLKLEYFISILNFKKA